MQIVPWNGSENERHRTLSQKYSIKYILWNSIIKIPLLQCKMFCIEKKIWLELQDFLSLKVFTMQEEFV